MSAPSERHDVVKAINYLGGLIKHYRLNEDYESEAKAWDSLVDLAQLGSRMAHRTHELLQSLGIQEPDMFEFRNNNQ